MVKCAYSNTTKSCLSASFIKSGHYRRTSDGKKIQRYRCLNCKRSFSSATNSPLRGQNKRRINSKVFEYLCSGVSQRRAARLLRVNRTTIVRKFRFFASRLQDKTILFDNINEIQFDHMETLEHTKLKPISILVVVDKVTRRILTAKASSMPSKGLLVHKSLKKYGKRKDDRRVVMEEAFFELSQKYPHINKIESDESPLYPALVRKYFLRTKYRRYKGRLGCVTGQGELKRGGKDPLFSLNHTCAMFRANINRLFRRTWCTSKKIDQLQLHLDLYVHYHNSFLIS